MVCRRGSARRAAGQRLPTSLGSGLVFAAPDAPPELSPASAILCGCRRPRAGTQLADFLVLRVRPRDALGPPERAARVSARLTLLPPGAGRVLFLQGRRC